MLNKFLYSCICGLSLLLVFPSGINASWESPVSLLEKPNQGPPGPMGKQGELGRLAQSYASVHGETQSIQPNNFFSIHFGKFQLPSDGVEHPVGNNDTLFKVKNGGVYMIEWTITATSPVADHVRFNLLNAKSLQDLKPFPHVNFSLQADEIKVISGQTFTHLAAGDAFQFEVFSEQGSLQITPLLNVMRITP